MYGIAYKEKGLISYSYISEVQGQAISMCLLLLDYTSALS